MSEDVHCGITYYGEKLAAIQTMESKVTVEDDRLSAQ